MKMSFLGAIGHLMTNSCLKDILEQVYAANTVCHMFTGKAISRAVRGHFLVYTSLQILLGSKAYSLSTSAEALRETEPIFQGVPQGDIDDVQIVYDNLISGHAPEGEDHVNPAVTKLSRLLEDTKASLKDHSRAAALWLQGGGPGVVVSTAAFHARVRGSVPGLGGLKETKMFLPHPRVKVSIVGSLRDREVACSASDRQGSNFESCVWRTVSSRSSHHPQEVLLAQFSLYVHKGGLKPDSFHFHFYYGCNIWKW